MSGDNKIRDWVEIALVGAAILFGPVWVKIILIPSLLFVFILPKINKIKPDLWPKVHNLLFMDKSSREKLQSLPQDKAEKANKLIEVFSIGISAVITPVAKPRVTKTILNLKDYQFETLWKISSDTGLLSEVCKIPLVTETKTNDSKMIDFLTYISNASEPECEILEGLADNYQGTLQELKEVVKALEE